LRRPALGDGDVALYQVRAHFMRFEIPEVGHQRRILCLSLIVVPRYHPKRFAQALFAVHAVVSHIVNGQLSNRHLIGIRPGEST